MKNKNLIIPLLVLLSSIWILSACFSAPQTGTLNPTFVSVMKDTGGTHDALGSLIKVKLDGITANGNEVNLLVSVDSQAQQADLVIELPAINGKPVHLTDHTGATGEKLLLLSGQQVVTATFPRPANSKDWSVMITVSNVNGVEGNFGWPLPIAPYYK